MRMGGYCIRYEIFVNNAGRNFYPGRRPGYGGVAGGEARTENSRNCPAKTNFVRLVLSAEVRRRGAPYAEEELLRFRFGAAVVVLRRSCSTCLSDCPA